MYREQIYFPLLLLYVKSEHFQSSELLQSLFSRGLRLFCFFFFSQKLIHMPVAMCLSLSFIFNSTLLFFLHFSITDFSSLSLHIVLKLILKSEIISLCYDKNFLDTEFAAYSCTNNFIQRLSYVYYLNLYKYL